MMRQKAIRWVKRCVIWTVLVAGAAGAAWWWNRLPVELPQFQTVTLRRGELVQIVTASGQLNPMVKVEVGSQISGIIQKLLADFNSPVKEGQVVAQLDAATYEANLIQAEGNLANAKAALELAKLNAARAQALQTNTLIARADYDKAVVELHQAEANVRINEGALKKAQVDVARCTVYAPIDGVVISRNVNVGQTVAASLSAPTLFVIANDLAKMQIEANVAEADIGVVEVGQEVNFTVDAFPGRTFHGTVRQIRNAPTAEQNVVTYDTVIEVNNPNLKLKPGMTANVSIVVARRDQALKVPNAAFRFRPPSQAESTKPVLAGLLGGASATSSQKADGPTHKKDKRKSERTVFVLSANGQSADAVTNRIPAAVAVKTGISDNTYSEVLDGLQEGDEVVIGLTQAKSRLPELNSLFSSSKKKH